MIRRNQGTVIVAAALVVLFALAFLLATVEGKLPVLALDLTEHLFGIILAVFVFERMLAWREERRWLPAKDWLYLILLETIDGRPPASHQERVARLVVRASTGPPSS